MKTPKFQIIRLVNENSKFETGADILVLRGWHCTSLYAAVRLCELARLRYGGNWVPAINGADTVTVYLGYTVADFQRKAHRRAA